MRWMQRAIRGGADLAARQGPRPHGLTRRAGGGLTVEGNFHLTRGETEGLAAQLT
jgi:hypothetical protein